MQLMSILLSFICKPIPYIALPITAIMYALNTDDNAYRNSPAHSMPINSTKLTLAPTRSNRNPENIGNIILGMESADDKIEYSLLVML
jgi:hypothetical protein